MPAQDKKIEQQSVNAMWLNNGEPVFFQGLLRKEMTSTGEEVFTFYPHQAQEPLLEPSGSEASFESPSTPQSETTIIAGDKLLVTLEDGSMLTMVVSEHIKGELTNAEQQAQTEQYARQRRADERTPQKTRCVYS